MLPNLHRAKRQRLCTPFARHKRPHGGRISPLAVQIVPTIAKEAGLGSHRGVFSTLSTVSAGDGVRGTEACFQMAMGPMTLEDGLNQMAKHPKRDFFTTRKGPCGRGEQQVWMCKGGPCGKAWKASPSEIGFEANFFNEPSGPVGATETPFHVEFEERYVKESDQCLPVAVVKKLPAAVGDELYCYYGDKFGVKYRVRGQELRGCVVQQHEDGVRFSATYVDDHGAVQKEDGLLLSDIEVLETEAPWRKKWFNCHHACGLCYMCVILRRDGRVGCACGTCKKCVAALLFDADLVKELIGIC